MSCAVSSFNQSSEGFEDLVSGHGPDERLLVLVPGRQPVAEVFLECLHTAVIAALEEVACHFSEEPFDLVDLG